MAKGQPSKRKGTNPKSDKSPRKFSDPISYDDKNFSWRVHDNYIDYDHDAFGWAKVDIKHLLRKIVQPLQSFEGYTWHEVKQKRHCHYWGLDEIPKECYARLEERQLDIEELFQIGLGNKQRIIGHKTGRAI